MQIVQKNAQTKALRKENKSLQAEIFSLRTHVSKLEEDILKYQEKTYLQETSILSSDEAKTLDFVSDKCDDVVSLQSKTLQELAEIKSKLVKISERCAEISAYIDHADDYSYQYNLKITGIPSHSTNESAEETAEICMKLFTAIGANVTIQDIDIAHRIPPRRPSDKPNPIVCRFVRRLAKNAVLAKKRFVSSVTPDEIGLDSTMPVNWINDIKIFEHLSPRQQTLFYEAKQFKNTNGWKYCWVKNGVVLLRESDDSRVYKLRNLEQLSNVGRHD